MRPILADLYDFPRLRESGCIYVDKTAWLHRLITEPGRSLFFLARPRRFGKSLMISTLKAIFQGRRELFTGLAIDQTDYDWRTSAVLHFDFSVVSTRDFTTFKKDFADVVARQMADSGGLSYDPGKTPGTNLADAIRDLHRTHGSVALLIDEYDAPVGHALDRVELAEQIRGELAEFYIQIKEASARLRFLMMTGVSKFSKMAVFSALNNLNDISFEDDYALMLGYTEEELTANFEEHLRAHAATMQLPYADYRARLKWWYNGYRFAPFTEETVYNPVAISKTLGVKFRVFRATWTSTGRASLLMNFLKRRALLNLDYEKVANVSEAAFDASDLRNLQPVAMLYQAGYLTIRDYSPLTGFFTLGVPDEEVRRDLAAIFVSTLAQQNDLWTFNAGRHLFAADWPSFFAELKALYAHLPYGATERRVAECSYQRCLCMLLTGNGVQWRAEDVQADGRADIVATHPCGVYIFELKVDATAAEALAQVKEKGYDAPYRASGRPVWAVGLSFDRATRHLADAAAERLG